MSNWIKREVPFKNENEISTLKEGDKVLLSGTIFTARDQAHLRLCHMIEKGEKLPVEMKNSIIYYCGPTPTMPGKNIGSCGPTTSSRTDKFSPILIEAGVKGMIGKGARSEEVIKSIRKNGAIYFIAPSGCGAYLSERVSSCKIVAFKDLGPEAIYEIEVKDFPCIVAVI